jgi:cell division protein FtsL
MENKSNNKDNKPNEETKPDNEEKPVDGVIIKEKTFLEKYLVFVIIGAILLLVIVYLLIS